MNLLLRFVVWVRVSGLSHSHTASKRLLELGVFVIGFGYPVVPKGTARLRVQISAAHRKEHLDRALDAFSKL